jgi:lantibiotic leader peptide-processing serine protease
MRRFTTIIAVLSLAAAVCLSRFVPIKPAHASAMQNYVVLYKQQATPADLASTVALAGGVLVYSYDAIGVAIARSDNDLFRDNLLRDNRIENAAATTRFAVALNSLDAAADPTVITPGTPSPGNDNLSGLQWDMIQIHSPEARTINGGSSSVVVGDIDTGLDYTHPDLAPNVDFANSVSCLGGVPDPTPAAWFDASGHGTHTAGTIAAAKNTIGIVGVAPNVKIAGIRAGNADGFFYPEAVICAFVWAGSHHLNVTNNSYFVDPFYFNCRNNAEQRAIWKAEQRAIRYALQQGVTVVAAEGNFSDDLSHPTRDVISPDDTTGVTREITNACIVIPTEISGVIGVTANGNKLLKSYYSNYGMGVTQVIAPGGDRRFQVTAAAPNGRVLSTWPASLAGDCALSVVDGTAVYCYLQGTSMASPHVAGVAALIVSRGITSPGAVAAKIKNTADPLACPTDLSSYAAFPSMSNGAPQVCQGGKGYNSFNGSGQVNALTAVTK